MPVAQPITASPKTRRRFLSALASNQTCFRSAIGHPSLETYIGHCINIAARAEGVGKILHNARTVFSDNVIEAVAEYICGQGYEVLRKRELDHAGNDRTRREIQGRMVAMNQQLCLSYIHQHYLKGVDRPVHLYRLSNSFTAPGVPRFEALLRRLAEDDRHFAEVEAQLEKNYKFSV